MKDPYETLGVARTATDKEIKEAFKKLARKFHPDLHPDDKAAEGKFKDISAANDLLKDKEKRRRFDAGEIDAAGAERPRERFYPGLRRRRCRHLARSQRRTSPATRIWKNSSGERLQAAVSGDARLLARGQMSYVLPVEFMDTVNGAQRTITLPEGKTLQVTIPKEPRTGKCCD